MLCGCFSDPDADLATQTPMLFAIMVFKRFNFDSRATLLQCDEAYNLQPHRRTIHHLRHIGRAAIDAGTPCINEGIANARKVIPITDGIQVFWDQSMDRSIVVLLLASGSYPAATAFHVSDKILNEVAFDGLVPQTVAMRRRDDPPSALEAYFAVDLSLDDSSAACSDDVAASHPAQQ